MESNRHENGSRRFKLVIAYDGRPYSGWQSQSGTSTVQDTIQSALTAICPQAGSLQGSGRTDTGVSADAQAAHFDVPASWRMEAPQWQRALNATLPPSIRIMDAEPVPDDFHARFSAVAKTYRYRLFLGEVPHPLDHGLVWHHRCPHPLAAFADAALLFLGEHDFRAFSANRGDGKDRDRDCRRTIHRAECYQTGENSLTIEFSGTGFLYKMVRFLVGTIVYLVEGKLTIGEATRLLTLPAMNEKAPYCAPPDGLVLHHVSYPDPSGPPAA